MRFNFIRLLAACSYRYTRTIRVFTVVVKYILEMIEVSHRAEYRIDLPVVWYVVPKIVLRRSEYGRQPKRTDIYALEVIHFFGNALKKKNTCFIRNPMFSNFRCQ